MSNHQEHIDILEELWNTRRQLEKEAQNDIQKSYDKMLARQLKNPAEYYFGKPVYIQQLKVA